MNDAQADNDDDRKVRYYFTVACSGCGEGALDVVSDSPIDLRTRLGIEVTCLVCGAKADEINFGWTDPYEALRD